MSSPYFQGSSVQGPVKASDAQSFRDVVDKLRVCHTLPLTREAFLALDEKKRNEAKQVPFFVPAVFKQSPSKRNYENALHANLIFLDIDPEKENRDGKWVETGRYPAAPFVRNSALLDEALRNFNFVAHVTASSTPEKPRMRIIVDASEIPIEEYPRAVATIAALLGLPSITRESNVAVQPMFMPSLFHDSPPDYSPILTHNLSGRPFTRADIDDSLDSYHGVNGKNGKNGKHPTRSSPGLDALDCLKAPVPEISLLAAKEMLGSIDADLSYIEWLEVAASLKHQFCPQKEDEAYELFDEWSSTGHKYAGEDETKAKWKSLQQSPNGRLPVTIRSLMKRAVAGGWNDKRVRENCFTVTLRWFEEAPSVMDLLEHGVKKVMGTPLITAMQEDILITHLCTQAKKRFGHIISSTSVRKDLAKAKELLRAHQAAPKKTKEPLWSKDVVFIIGADEFYRYRTGEKMKTSAFNAAYSRHLMAIKQDDEDEENAPPTPEMESTPMARPSDFALNKLQIPTVQDYTYDPSQPNEKLLVQSGCRLINTYNPTYPPADPKNAKWAGELLLHHITHLVAEPEYRRTLLDFMAYLVQAPGRKIRWAVLIQSVEGAGKTFLAEVMKAVLGAEHVKTIDGGSIKSGWNEWAFGKSLIVLEEVRVQGVTKHEIMNALKPLITNDDISVNERFRNNRQVANISNYMIFSNHHDALALTPGDRRYFVIKSPLQTKDQVLALGDDYFPPLYAMLRDFPGALRSFLADWEISPDFRPDGHAPRTKYVQEMVMDSSNDLHSSIRRLLIEADYPLIQYDIVSASVLKTVLLHEEGLTRVTAQQIGQVLREEGLHQLGRITIDDERHYVWARAGITEAQATALTTDRAKRGLKNLGMDLLY